MLFTDLITNSNCLQTQTVTPGRNLSYVYRVSRGTITHRSITPTNVALVTFQKPAVLEELHRRHVGTGSRLYRCQQRTGRSTGMSYSYVHITIMGEAQVCLIVMYISHSTGIPYNVYVHRLHTQVYLIVMHNHITFTLASMSNVTHSNMIYLPCAMKKKPAV